MIQNIEPLKFDNSWRAVEPDDESVILYYSEKKFFVSENEGIRRFPKFSEWPDRDMRFTYLFSISSTKYFLAETERDIEIPGFSMENISSLRTTRPKDLAFAGITGFQLASWYKNRAFCGRCGRPTSRSLEERMVCCEDCGLLEYPKLSPAVIVAVTDGDRIVLTQYAGREFKNYALIAGFTEIGETLEETVAREVLEEVGLKVKNIRYYKSQPWSFSDTVLMGFYADLDGSDTIKLDERELEKAVWVKRGDIDVVYQDLSLTNEMICNFAGTLPAKTE